MNDEEIKPETETPAEPPKAEWKYQKGFRINEEMKSVIQATIKLAESEVDRYRRKLAKLRYGA